MNSTAINGPEPFGRTVWLLWKAARHRNRARLRHQRKLLRARKGDASGIGPGFATVILAVFMAVLHGFLGYMTVTAVETGALVEPERNGKLVVSHSSLLIMKASAASNQRLGRSLDLNTAFQDEAATRVQRLGGSRRDQEQTLWNHYLAVGRAGFVSRKDLPTDLTEIGEISPLGALSGTILFVWWFVMLSMQGEGLDLDVQRRRHPMWEWLLSHPVRPEASFLAEMVSPVVANPAYLSAPVYWIVLFAQVYDFPLAIAAGIVVGLLFAVAAALLNKTLELCAMLKLSVRSRGAVLGLMSWLGYALFITPMFIFGKPPVMTAVVKFFAPAAASFHPNLLRWLLGNWQDHSFSLAVAFGSSLAVCGSLAVVCILVGRWGTATGLEGGFDNIPKTPWAFKLSKTGKFGREPLHRKELLWFFRDRSALVQAVLIPLTMAAIQAFNLSNVIQSAGESWSGFCGLAVISGTYFLIVLGPRSLSSEGPALWIPLTWPRGLEDLLKAKARLWLFLSSTVVFAVLVFAAMRFPAEIWKIALVAVGWWIFGRSLAEKAVTLVNAPSSSGERQPVSRSRQWTAMLGTLAFGTGIFTRNWHLAIIGLVFSSLTAAAMWQNLRARLPFLFDPWSEKLPPAPTLMHAMIAIAAMAEGIAVITAVFMAVGGTQSLNIARSLAYGVGSVITYLIVQKFLRNRGVTSADIWTWRTETKPVNQPTSDWVMKIVPAALAAGALGICAVAYRHWVLNIPAITQFLQQHREFSIPRTGQQTFWWLAVLVIGFAPPAEEYLFRGLLFRALDREWGGTRALFGSAVFFAVYHPPISWLPVGALGLLNAYLFKRTRHLAPCVVAHMVYNSIVMIAP
jgi:membrane protease YdiL (CAAX protease family)